MRSLLPLLLCLVTILFPVASLRADDDAAVRVDPFGDFRLRSELTEYQNRPTRFRPRIRLRVGAVLDLGNDLYVGARVVTGNPADPRSAHQTLGQGGNSFTLSLDRAYLEWRPEQVKGLLLRGGKFQDVLRRPTVMHDLLVDDDVQPTGITARWQSGNSSGLIVALGHYLVDESARNEDTRATEAQIGLRLGASEKLQLRVYADAFLMDIGDSTTVDRLGHPTGRGNLVENRMFVSDFHIVQGFVELEARALGQPLVLGTGVMHNLRAFEHKNDTGWFAGAMFGKVAGWGTGRAYLQVQEVEQEAVFTPWAQDDLPDDQGSRYRGVLGGVALGVSERFAVHAWVLASRLLDPLPGEVDAWLERYRLDLNLRF